MDAAKNLNALSQCTAAALFLFFVNLTNIITFGGVMGGMLHSEMVTSIGVYTKILNTSFIMYV